MQTLSGLCGLQMLLRAFLYDAGTAFLLQDSVNRNNKWTLTEGAQMGRKTQKIQSPREAPAGSRPPALQHKHVYSRTGETQVAVAASIFIASSDQWNGCCEVLTDTARNIGEILAVTNQQVCVIQAYSVWWLLSYQLMPSPSHPNITTGPKILGS